MLTRKKNRKNDEFREIKITKNYLNKIPSSVLVEFGDTKVLCTATYEQKQPSFLSDTTKGWVTAEYSMLPASTRPRSQRERNKINARNQEIQRLIGRALRGIVDLNKLNSTSVVIDCDVLQADGGTRTASITGAYVSLYLTLREMVSHKIIETIPLLDSISAISIGIIGEEIITDLDYDEDSKADVDMNFVITGSGKMVEVQGTAEHNPFTKEQLDQMYSHASSACEKLKEIQKNVLE